MFFINHIFLHALKYLVFHECLDCAAEHCNLTDVEQNLHNYKNVKIISKAIEENALKTVWTVASKKKKKKCNNHIIGPVYAMQC